MLIKFRQNYIDQMEIKRYWLNFIEKCCLPWIDNIAKIQFLIAVIQLLCLSFSQQIIVYAKTKKILIKLDDHVMMNIGSSNFHEVIKISSFSTELYSNTLISDLNLLSQVGGGGQVAGLMRNKANLSKAAYCCQLELELGNMSQH